MNSPACKQSAQSLPREEQCFPAALQYGLSYHTQRCQGKAGPFPEHPSASAKQKAEALLQHSLLVEGRVPLLAGKWGLSSSNLVYRLSGSMLRSLRPGRTVPLAAKS